MVKTVRVCDREKCGQEIRDGQRFYTLVVDVQSTVAGGPVESGLKNKALDVEVCSRECASAVFQAAMNAVNGTNHTGEGQHP